MTDKFDMLKKKNVMLARKDTFDNGTFRGVLSSANRKANIFVVRNGKAVN